MLVLAFWQGVTQAAGLHSLALVVLSLLLAPPLSLLACYMAECTGSPLHDALICVTRRQRRDDFRQPLMTPVGCEQHARDRLRSTFSPCTGTSKSPPQEKWEKARFHYRHLRAPNGQQ
ncbi:unnamed protein product [Discosporangium mesarthrocarpum]